MSKQEFVIEIAKEGNFMKGLTFFGARLQKIDYKLTEWDTTLRGAKSIASREVKRYAQQLGKGNYSVKIALVSSPDISPIHNHKYLSSKNYYYSGYGWIAEDPNWTDTELGRQVKSNDWFNAHAVDSEYRQEQLRDWAAEQRNHDRIGA